MISDDWVSVEICPTVIVLLLSFKHAGNLGGLLNIRFDPFRLGCLRRYDGGSKVAAVLICLGLRVRLLLAIRGGGRRRDLSDSLLGSSARGGLARARHLGLELRNFVFRRFGDRRPLLEPCPFTLFRYLNTVSFRCEIERWAHHV